MEAELMQADSQLMLAVETQVALQPNETYFGSLPVVYFLSSMDLAIANSGK